jgi:BirA family biotin operon repressor/biotin-[acetyl-CoA-carboxylase] ligase
MSLSPPSESTRSSAGPLNIAAIESLADCAPDWIGIDQLAGRLGIDLRQLGRDLIDLEQFGFSLEHHPHYGLRYAGPAARLCPDQMEWHLNTRLIGRRIAVWNRVTSTNDLAMRAAHSKVNEGLVVFAEEQTHGRGRRGRRWEAPTGTGLLMSVLLFPPAKLRDPVLLTCLAAVAVCDTLEQSFNLAPRLKWPNDVQVDERKVCGILVELADGAVIGIGLNAGDRPKDFPAELRATSTSVAESIGGPVDRSLLARRLLQTLDQGYHQLGTHGPEPLWRRWCDRAGLIGADVEIELGRERLNGVIKNIDAQGTLDLDPRDEPPRAVRLQHVLSLTVRA